MVNTSKRFGHNLLVLSILLSGVLFTGGHVLIPTPSDNVISALCRALYTVVLVGSGIAVIRFARDREGLFHKFASKRFTRLNRHRAHARWINYQRALKHVTIDGLTYSFYMDGAEFSELLRRGVIDEFDRITPVGKRLCLNRH